MSQIIEVNPGELKISFETPSVGKQSFKDLGLESEELFIESGFMRMVFNMDKLRNPAFYNMPTIEVSYKENLAATHWQCDFNGVTILDKIDHHGNATILILQKKKLEELQNHHENRLILHAEFPENVHILPEKSYINFFK